eukprot:2280017-Amphidinium_carterae.1
MFCVANKQGRNFIILFVCSACFLLTAAGKMVGRPRRMYGKFAQAKAAWYDTSKQQGRLLAASCVLLALYNDRVYLACTVVAERMRFNFLPTGRPLE